MKHNIKITIILLLMFLVTQFIGLYVVNFYSNEDNDLPYGMSSPEIEKESDYYALFSGIIFAFIFAILILFFLTKFNLSTIIKIWFFFVILIALGIFFNSILFNLKYSYIISLLISLPLVYIKIYKNNFLIHNLTEFLIYPGIAAVFVPILNVYTIIFLLFLISIYDMWAVWKSGIMQKMAKYQLENLKVFSGFFMPYLSKKQKKKIKFNQEKNKKNQKIKVNVAILGGGDIIFPIITAGVFLVNISLVSSIFIILGATLGLATLFIFSEKKKFYPAMPFITLGIFLGMIIFKLIF
jgi:presenilin-like A22 family membrane protease